MGRLLRATALIGDALGHSWVGLLLLRAMDFRLQTPVPLAYAYKTMMFFVPASGSKNAIVVGKRYRSRDVGASFTPLERDLSGSRRGWVNEILKLVCYLALITFCVFVVATMCLPFGGQGGA